MRIRIVLLLVSAFIVVMSCGESTGPSVPDLSPSTLSLEFTGDSSKIGIDRDCSSIQITPLSISTRELNDGEKGDCEVTASWTICPENSFHSYILYRSENPGISSSPSSAEVLGVFTDPNTTEFADAEIEWATKYYFALRTSDTDENSVWSNEASITTPGTVPTPSVLTNEDVSWDWSGIAWTTCPDMDFESYRLYRSLEPNIEQDTTLSECIYVALQDSSSQYVDETVDPETLYYYILVTTNNKDMYSWSNEISVTTLEAPPDSVVATVDVGNQPLSICALPSGDYVYVTSAVDDCVSVIRTVDNTVVATVDVGDQPYGICSLPSGDYVYVTSAVDEWVRVIRTADNTVVATIDVGDQPYAICSLPSGDYAYVANYHGTVSVIRTSDNTVVATVGVGDRPNGICSLPSGDYVYVTNMYDDNVSVIRTADNTVVATVYVGDDPRGICSLPSGDYVYVTNYSDENVSVVRTYDNTVVATVDVGDQPYGICSLPSGDYVFVVNRLDDNVSVIRTADNTVVATIGVGDSPHCICCLPSGDRVYVANTMSDCVSVIE